MINIKGHEIPNQVDELTIGQFQKISAINGDLALNYVEKQIKVFTELGVPDIWDEVSAKELKTYISAFNDVPNREFEYVKEVEIDGYTYKAFEDEFELNAKDLSLIEKKIKEGTTDISYIMAVIFKRTDLTKKEHYTEAHLKQKAKLFAEQPAELCVKYITKVGQEASELLEKKVSDVEDDNA